MALPANANPAMARRGRAFSFLLLTRAAVVSNPLEDEATRREARRRALEASIVARGFERVVSKYPDIYPQYAYLFENSEYIHASIFYMMTDVHTFLLENNVCKKSMYKRGRKVYTWCTPFGLYVDCIHS
jgi:hypothetical protein